MSETKEQDKTSEKELNETGNLPNKEVEVIMVIKMHTRLKRRVDELNENPYKEIENIKENLR